MKDKRSLFYYCLFLAIGFVLCLTIKQCETDVKPEATHTIDTIEKIKYIVKKIKVNNPPKTVIIYRDRDTILRKQREKEPIIENIVIKKNEIDVTTIDSTGAIKTEIHKFEPDSKLTIDNTGQIEEKKKTKIGKLLKKVWKGTKTGLAIVGTAAITVIVIIAANK